VRRELQRKKFLLLFAPQKLFPLNPSSKNWCGEEINENMNGEYLE